MMRLLFIYSLAIQLAVLAAPAQAALSPALVWEIRPGVGVAANGGGFVAGATGTDFSQQDAAQYTFTNLASVTGTTNPCIVTSVSHNFVAADVGNLLHVTAGTNWIPNFFQIVSVAANAATLDRACGTAAVITNGTFAVGGAIAALAPAVQATGRVGSNRFYVKATGTLTITATLTLNTTVTASSTVPPNRIIGYTSSRTDKGKASVTLSTNTGLTAFDGTGITGWYLENLNINCSSLGTSTGIALGDNSYAINVKVSNCTIAGISLTTSNFESVIDSEVTGCTSACTAAILQVGNGGQILRNWIHDNASPGLKFSNRGTIIFNLFSNNTGATSDAIVSASGDGGVILNNTIYGSGRDGIRFTGDDLVDQITIRNNLIVNSAGQGITGALNAGSPALSQYDGNAYFNNAGTRTNMDDTGAVNAIDAVSPYTNTLDVILTADPFVNAAGNNFSLNNTTGGGAAARYSGTPGPIPGNSFSGNQGQGSQQVGAVTRFAAIAQ
jgi:hypothetical protein